MDCLAPIYFSLNVYTYVNILFLHINIWILNQIIKRSLPSFPKYKSLYHLVESLIITEKEFKSFLDTFSVWYSSLVHVSLNKSSNILNSILHLCSFWFVSIWVQQIQLILLCNATMPVCMNYSIGMLKLSQP